MAPKILRYVCLVAVLAILPSCSQQSAIVGYWQWEEGQSFVEFRADGVFQSHGEAASKVTGRYSISGREKLKIHITGQAQPKEVLVAIKGDEMILTESKLVMKLHRVDPSKVSKLSPEEELSRRVNEWISPATNQPSKRKP